MLYRVIGVFLFTSEIFLLRFKYFSLIPFEFSYITDIIYLDEEYVSLSLVTTQSLRAQYYAHCCLVIKKNRNKKSLVYQPDKYTQTKTSEGTYTRASFRKERPYRCRIYRGATTV